MQFIDQMSVRMVQLLDMWKWPTIHIQLCTTVCLISSSRRENHIKQHKRYLVRAWLVPFSYLCCWYRLLLLIIVRYLHFDCVTYVNLLICIIHCNMLGVFCWYPLHSNCNLLVSVSYLWCYATADSLFVTCNLTV